MFLMKSVLGVVKVTVTFSIEKCPSLKSIEVTVPGS
jgi:hypothetical protein